MNVTWLALFEKNFILTMENSMEKFSWHVWMVEPQEFSFSSLTSYNKNYDSVVIQYLYCLLPG